MELLGLPVIDAHDVTPGMMYVGTPNIVAKEPVIVLCITHDHCIQGETHTMCTTLLGSQLYTWTLRCDLANIKLILLAEAPG